MGFQALAVQMGVAWGLGMLNRAMAGRPPRPPKPRPDDIEFPLTKIGTPVPIVFGTIKIDSPLLVWADLFTATLQPTSGIFRYGASCMFVLGTPPQRLQPGTDIAWWAAPVLRRIWIADRPISFAIPGGVLSHSNSLMVFEDLGGEANGGQILGKVQFFDGRADQLVTNYPLTADAGNPLDVAFAASAEVDRSLVPGYRHQLLLAVLCDTYTIGSDATFGEQAQFPAVAAEATCVDVDSVGTLDANPAWVIYDLICGEVYKLGYDADAVDLASFQECALQLVIEGNGCSGRIDAEEKIEDVVNRLLAQVDGAIDQDPNTGLIGMRLIRNVDPDTLPHLTIENTIGRPRVTETGWLENANYVDVTFTNRSKAYKQDMVPARRLANAINQRFRPRARTVDYPYCTTAVLAGKLAARDAALLCRPLMTASATVSREFYGLRRGDAIKATWPQLTVTDKVFRILDIDRGSLADDAIRLTLVEDVFDNVAGAIDATPGIDDLPVLHRFIDEAPRWLVQAAYFQGHITDTTSTRLLGAGRREPAQPAAVYYSALSGLAGDPFPTADVIAQTFPTSAKVVTAYPYHLEPYDTTTGLVIESVTGEIAAAFEDAGLLAANILDGGLVATSSQVTNGANLIRINGEMLAYESVTSLGAGQYRLNNVWRGLHDTVSDDHAIGDIVYWLDFDNVGQTAWGRGQALDTQPVGVPIELSNYDPPTDPITTTGVDFPVIHGRIGRPYRGADLSATALEHATGTAGLPAVAGHFKRVASVEGALDIVWRQRDATVTTVVRGDDATGYSVPGIASWRVLVQKVGSTEVEIAAPANAAVAQTNVLLGAAGHGEIDVLLRTVQHVFALNTGESWQDARVRVTAHRARNLLADSAGAALSDAAWTQVGGSSSIVTTGTSSLEQTAGGKYFRGNVGV